MIHEFRLLAAGSALCTTVLLISMFLERFVYETDITDFEIMLISSMSTSAMLLAMAMFPPISIRLIRELLNIFIAAIHVAQETIAQNSASGAELHDGKRIGAYPANLNATIEVPKGDKAAEAAFLARHPPRDPSYWQTPVYHGYRSAYKTKIRSMVQQGLLPPLSNWRGHLDGLDSLLLFQDEDLEEPERSREPQRP